jgi:hypothetical protein
MRLLKKYIPAAFLWIAWFCIAGHLMIPHDHHLLESFSDTERSCPMTHQASHHHSQLPFHCHAFNDLASEKAIIFSLTNLLADFSTFKQSDDPSKTCLLNLFSPYSDINFSIPDNYLLESSSLRAPPVTC